MSSRKLKTNEAVNTDLFSSEGEQDRRLETVAVFADLARGY